jgi:DNA-directed RNA polymerase subunit RPC12/RpoP
MFAPGLKERVEYRAKTFRWKCGCGSVGNPIRLDKNGRPYAHCKNCFRILFWAKPEKFLDPATPFCRCHPAPPLKPTKSKKRLTSWCPACGIRVFVGVQWEH